LSFQGTERIDLKESRIVYLVCNGEQTFSAEGEKLNVPRRRRRQVLHLNTKREKRKERRTRKRLEKKKKKKQMKEKRMQ
jgi:hypothetical protein